MSWSLRVVNGDLSLAGPGGFAIVTGTQKLIQDLKLWILEPRGTDPVHPDYGSNMDGGLLPDGTISPSVIGATGNQDTLMMVESEIRRVLLAYQSQQLDRLMQEQAQYDGKSSFSPGEVLYSINDVQVQQVGTVVLVKVNITASDGSNISFATPVGS